MITTLGARVVRNVLLVLVALAVLAPSAYAQPGPPDEPGPPGGQPGPPGGQPGPPGGQPGPPGGQPGPPGGPPGGPYGGTTTTIASDAQLSVDCALSAESAPVGGRLAAEVTGAPADDVVAIVVDGAQVASGSVPADEPTVVVLEFEVPALVGQYSVAAVGTSFTAECGSLGLVEVLAGDLTAEPGGGASTEGRGTLPFTGLTIAALLAVGAMLLLAGRLLVQRGRRRARRLGSRSTVAV